MDLLAGAWTRYKKAINDAGDTFNKDLVIWQRSTFRISRTGDEVADEQFVSVPLFCLMNNNDFRTWPITQTSEVGELDIQNMVMILNMQYLADNGYLNSQGRLSYDAAADRFVHQGLVYKAMGDTPIAQADGTYLLFQVILKREEIQTGQDPIVIAASLGFDFILPFSVT